MKFLLIYLVCMLHCLISFSQDNPKNIRIPLKGKESKLLYLSFSMGASLYVQGYDGDELTVDTLTPLIPQKSLIQEAQGLKRITHLLTPGFRTEPASPGYKVTEHDQQLSVTVADNGEKALLVKIPKAFNVRLAVYTNAQSTVSVRDIEGKVSISSTTPLIEVSNISAPLTIHAGGFYNTNAIHASNLNWASRDPSAKFALAISSLASDINLSLPEDLKATLRIANINGKLFSDLNLVPDQLDFKLNGGGTIISIRNEYGNTYIRKQK